MHHRKRLSDDDHFVAVKAVGKNSGNGSKQKTWKLAEETDHAKKKGGIRQPVNEPGDGKLLHPRAAKGNKLTSEKETEVAILKSSKDV